MLDRVPAVRQNEEVLSLVEAVLEEAKRLDQDIRKVLDATRIAARNLQTQAKAVSVFDLMSPSLASAHNWSGTNCRSMFRGTCRLCW